MFGFLKGLSKPNWENDCSTAVTKGREKFLRYMDGVVTESGKALPSAGELSPDQFAIVASLLSTTVGLTRGFPSPEYDGVLTKVPFDDNFRKREREFSMYHHFQHSLVWGKMNMPESVLPKISENFIMGMVLADFVTDQPDLANFRKVFPARMAEYGDCLSAQQGASPPNYYMAKILAREIFAGEDSPRTLRFATATASIFSSTMNRIEQLYSKFKVRETPN